MLKQIFRTDRKFWTQKNNEEVQGFFQFNSFFSTFYQHQDFQKVVAMTFYAKIHKNSELLLQFNKRPQTIILLSGQVQVFKKIYLDLSPKKKKKKGDKKMQDQIQYQSLGTYNKENSTISLGSQCKIESFNQSQAQILFIPSILYNAHEQKLKSEKINSLFIVLKKYFENVHKTPLLQLAKRGCYFKQFRMYDFVYRAGDEPDFVYILLDGNVKLQKPGFSAKKMFDMVVISPQILFGQTDILFQARQQSAMSCSAFIRTLIIPKIPFIKFAQQYLPKLQLRRKVQAQKLPQLKTHANSLYRLDLDRKQQKIFRFHSNSQLQKQTFIQKKLIRNCHMLVNLSPKGSKTMRMYKQQTPAQVRDYSKDQFRQKQRLFRRLRPNAKPIDFSNRLI